MTPTAHGSGCYLRGVSTKREYWAHLMAADAVAFDMESVGDEVIGLGVGTNEVQGYAVGDASIVELMELFEYFSGVKVAHAANADLSALGVTGDKRFAPIFDTMVAASLVIADPGPGTMGLKYLSATELGVFIDDFTTLIKRHGAKDLGGVPEQLVAEYNMSQVSATYQLWQKFSEIIDEDPKLSVVFGLEMQILPLLINMEETGILVDRKRLAELGRRFKDEGTALQEAVTDMTEGHIRNVNSPKQVSEYIFGKEPGQLGKRVIYRSKQTNKPSTNERVLKKLLAKNDEDGSMSFAKILLRAREIKKLEGTYCRGIAAGLDWESRSHSHLSQVTAETGRLASKDPNHQNIPKRRIEGLEIRRCFIAPPGHVLIACDMDQLELRLIMEEAGEEKMQQTFLDKEDVHMKTAVEILHDPKKRFAAKILNYTIVYLAGAQQIADQAGVSKKVAEMWQESYFRRNKKLTQWIKDWSALCFLQGYVETPLGRRRDVSRYFTINHDEGVRKSVNTRIQGAAAEIMKLNMVELDKMMKANNMRSRALIQVHDEMLVEAPVDEMDEMVDILRECMTTHYLNMPLPCTVKVGENWADVKGDYREEPVHLAPSQADSLRVNIDVH